MPPDRTQIRAVTVENFRGFLEARTIELDASATIVSGPNGSGKTSFFDALQWLMLGSIKRLAAVASRRSGDYVVNRFAPKNSRARVDAVLQLAEGSVVVSREGTAKENELTWDDGDVRLSGPDAEQRLSLGLLGDSELSLEDLMLTSGVLQQDVVRAVLEDEPKKRYRHMASMLGLNEIAGFQEETRRLSDAAKRSADSARDEHSALEQRSRRMQADVHRLEQRLVAQPDVAAGIERLETGLLQDDPPVEVLRMPSTTADAVTLGQEARRIGRLADDLLSEGASLRQEQAALDKVDADALESVADEERGVAEGLAVAQEQLRAAEAERVAAGRLSSEFAELAARALPVLSETCPVCGQDITHLDVPARLNELIRHGGIDLVKLDKAVSDAQQTVDEQSEALSRISRARESLEGLRRRTEDLAARRQSWSSACNDLEQRLQSIGHRTVTGVAAGEEGSLRTVRDFADRLSGVADELVALLGAPALSEEVERQRARARELSEATEAAAVGAAQASQRAADARTLADAATEAITGVASARFATLQPLIDDIFRRLDPHPAFSALGFDLSVAYRSGVADPVVHDPERLVSADPLIVFSSSQANVAALTYFLALSWAGERHALPFLLLDDPLQSMDDVNALGFSDLCRHIRRRRQLVVSTHDRRLATLLERKLLPRDENQTTRVVRFSGWDRGGPKFKQSELEGQLDAPYLLSAG